MRIDKINFYTNNVKQNNSRQTNPINNNLIVFKGNDADKVIFSDKIRGIFMKEKPKTTPEYDKSEEIKYFLGDINCFNKELHKLGKYHKSTLKTMYAIGKFDKYNGYIPLKGEDERLLFSEKNETGFPSKVSHIKLDDGIKIIKSYDLHLDFDLFTVNDNSNKEKPVTMTVGKKKVRHYTEHDKKTGAIKEIAITSKGFVYQEYTVDDETGEATYKYSIDFKFDENERSTYEERNESGDYDLYVYNKETDLWEKEGTNINITTL